MTNESLNAIVIADRDVDGLKPKADDLLIERDHDLVHEGTTTVNHLPRHHFAARSAARSRKSPLGFGMPITPERLGSPLPSATAMP